MPDSAPQPIADFKRFLAEGRFMIQRSRSSGRHVFYPRVVTPGTGAADLEWVEASGLGTVYATTVQRAKVPAADTNVVLVDLDEGPRMMSRVEGLEPAAVTIGLRVRARIAREGDEAFVVFDPTGERAA